MGTWLPFLDLRFSLRQGKYNNINKLPLEPYVHFKRRSVGPCSKNLSITLYLGRAGAFFNLQSPSSGSCDGHEPGARSGALSPTP